jgi:hypothetical protein
MPFFGDKQKSQFQGKLGAPPPVLTFSGWRGLVGEVPVILSQLSWSWPKDCDWIPTGIMHNGEEVPFPTVMIVSVNLIESFSPEQMNAFDLVSFRNGNMVGAWSNKAIQNSAAPVSEPTGGQQGITNGTPTPTGNDAGTPPTEAVTTTIVAAQNPAVNAFSTGLSAIASPGARTITNAIKNNTALEASISANTTVLENQPDAATSAATQAVINSDLERRKAALDKIAKTYNLDISSTNITL